MEKAPKAPKDLGFLGTPRGKFREREFFVSNNWKLRSSGAFGAFPKQGELKWISAIP